jgi:glycosyltransferase involved in cell wall biosynthesis
MTHSVKPRLLVFNDYFYPAYKAGGPIQSLVNLIIHLNDQYEIYVITSACDLNEYTPMEGVESGKWCNVKLPGSQTPVSVWYVGKNEKIKTTIKTAVQELRPAVIYINGMFTYKYVILPLLLIKNIKTVICPRGMIQAGALAGKYLKKKIYLTILRFSGVISNIWWHATTEVEQEDIRKLFGDSSRVVVAGNIPRKPVSLVTYADKQEGKLRLIYLSLVTAKKNLLQAIEAIIRSNNNISLDIYGPIKDTGYWEKCELAIRRSAGRIQYKGDVKPELVQLTFAKYDAGLFLTKAENFGHALYESLSSGRPIITSYFTPWHDLESKQAGWNVDIDNLENIITTLNKVADLPSSEFNNYCTGAHLLANEYYNQGFNLEDYKKLF